MTNTEALAAVVQIEQIPANAYEKALEDAGLIGGVIYSSIYKDSVNTAAIAVLSGLLYTSISEGGYSISFDRQAVQNKIASLGGGPKVRGLNVW